MDEKGVEKGLNIKLDFENAHDKLNWNFLFSMMQKMGFSKKWMSWIKYCVSTASLSVFVNGSTTEEF